MRAPYLPIRFLTFILAMVFLLALVFFIACKKTIPSTSTNNPGGNTANTTVAVTDIGFPVGDSVSAIIGPGGGTLSSPDGRIDLIIPAGALSANTEISIQPILNECPGGIGLAYELLPGGTHFAKPATLTFHYTDDDMDGTCHRL